MQLIYSADAVQNPLQVLRQSGYKHFIDPVTKKESFVLHLTAGFYPRFHIYVKQQDEQLIIDLHLDQKKASYAGSNMHGGEYDGPQVEKEIKRIAGWVHHATSAHPINFTQQTEAQIEEDIPVENEASPLEESETPKQENDLFSGIFG